MGLALVEMGLNNKNCFYCGSIITKRNGVKSGKQLYKCMACGKQFVVTSRLQPTALWQQCIEGKQTYQQKLQKMEK